MTISYKTSIAVYDRAQMRCENPECGSNQPAHLHHVFFKSQYFGKDRDEVWNLSLLCEPCHSAIHHTGGGILLNWHLKRRAFFRYTGEEKQRAKLKQILKQVTYKAKAYESTERRRQARPRAVYEDRGGL